MQLAGVWHDTVPAGPAFVNKQLVDDFGEGVPFARQACEYIMMETALRISERFGIVFDSIEDFGHLYTKPAVTQKNKTGTFARCRLESKHDELT